MGGPKTQFNRAMLVAVGAVLPVQSTAQQCNSLRSDRVLALTGVFAVAQAVTIAARHDDWWDTPSTSFHIRWDDSPNKEQDGLLHTAIAYQTSQVAALAWDWTCVERSTAGWLGALTGVAISIPKEIGDGLHEDRGFSARDMLWTLPGAALPALHRSWPASRSVQLKVSYWPSQEFRDRPPGQLPQLENDYAGQRYFLAVNPGRRPGGSGAWPAWLGVAVGHSIPHWVSQPPIHEWYLTLDVSLRGIPARAGWWNTVASGLDQIHFPLPGIRLRDGRVALGLF